MPAALLRKDFHDAVAHLKLWARMNTRAEAPGRVQNLNFKEFRVFREVAAARLCYHDDVFEPDTAGPFIIKARFDSDDMTGFQNIPSASDAGQFVNIEAKPMAGSVKESLHTAAKHARPETEFFEIPVNGLVDFTGVDPFADHAKADFLPFMDRIVHGFQFPGSLAANDGAREVRKVTRARIPGKDIHDNRLVGVERS